MIRVILPHELSDKGTGKNQEPRLVYFLAAEEYIADHLDEFCKTSDGDVELFFLWQSAPTVIFGRNQVMEAEVNLDFCKAEGIELYRRKSGGGCVYSDRGNVMVSYITNRTDVNFTFHGFLQKLALCLRRLGTDAEVSGRNDVLIGGRKVSGNAFFLRPKAGIVHGTLLFDSDFDKLEKAITPSTAKISSKGVSSVRRHVTNIREELKSELNIEQFKSHVINFFCDDQILITKEQDEAIRKIEQGYLDPDFLSGRNHCYTLERKVRIEGVGELNVALEMEGEQISACHLSGDFFPLKDNVDAVLSERLKGLGAEDFQAASRALEGLQLGDYVLNLTNSQFLESLFKNIK